MKTAALTVPAAAESLGVAWGKVILLGEHSVVYGRRALASAISRRIEIRVGDVYSSPPPTRDRGAASDPRFHAGIVRAAELLEVDASDLVVRVESDLPPGVGLGSSAALSVALVRALAAFAGSDICNAEVCAHAYELERIFHGTPSGIDNTAATHGGLFVFQRGEPPRQVEAPEALSLVVAVGKTPRKTQSTVAGVRARWQADQAVYEALFDAIDALVGEAEEALAGGDAHGLGSTMNENQALLGRIGVSTLELDELVAFARARGALGAKLTGGGGGGAIIALCRDAAEAEALAAAYGQAGIQAFTTVVESTPTARTTSEKGGASHRLRAGRPRSATAASSAASSVVPSSSTSAVSPPRSSGSSSGVA